MCIIIDEANRKSISNVLWHKLKMNEQFARETVTEKAPNPDLKIPFESAFEEQGEKFNLRETATPPHVKDQAMKALSIVP